MDYLAWLPASRRVLEPEPVQECGVVVGSGLRWDPETSACIESSDVRREEND